MEEFDVPLDVRRAALTRGGELILLARNTDIWHCTPGAGELDLTVENSRHRDIVTSSGRHVIMVARESLGRYDVSLRQFTRSWRHELEQLPTCCVVPSGGFAYADVDRTHRNVNPILRRVHGEVEEFRELGWTSLGWSTVMVAPGMADPLVVMTAWMPPDPRGAAALSLEHDEEPRGLRRRGPVR